MSIKRIGVTTDFSDGSRRAFPVAASLAKRFSAELCVLHQAVLTLLVAEPVSDTEQLFDSLEKTLSDLTSTDSAFRDVEAVPVMIRGGNMRTFGERVDQEEIDLVVIAAHGRRGVKRVLLGSFIERLLRVTSCPILAYRESRSRHEVQSHFSPERILVPHDFSEPSTKTIEVAREWARIFSAKVELLSVVDTSRGVTGFQADMLGGWEKYREKVKAVATQGLQRTSEDWGETAPETAVSEGHPAEEILSRAKDFRADLIVMGSHGDSSPQDILFESTAERVIRQSESSVLLVRSPRSA